MNRRWCFTLNNYGEDDLPSILKWNAKYLCVGSEVSSSGTPHLQGFVIFKKNYRLSGVRKLLPTAHWEITNGTSKQASDYCKKDNDYKEIGILSEQGKRTDLIETTDLLDNGTPLRTVARQFPSTFVKYSRGLREYALLTQEPYEHVTVRGVWIYGPPGTGKSHSARHFDPNAYIKAQNKWWDGYDGEETVILDDLDTNVLGHYLKIWADKWPCTGETKGGTVHLRHKLFVVTSNYTPNHFWPDDPVMTDAIMRRFKVIEKLDRNLIVDYLVLK